MSCRCTMPQCGRGIETAEEASNGRESGNIMTTAELTASKLYYADIKQLLDEGLIERVRRGYYHWTQDYGESEVVFINRLFSDAVLCMETALFIIDTVLFSDFFIVHTFFHIKSHYVFMINFIVCKKMEIIFILHRQFRIHIKIL